MLVIIVDPTEFERETVNDSSNSVSVSPRILIKISLLVSPSKNSKLPFGKELLTKSVVDAGLTPEPVTE